MISRTGSPPNREPISRAQLPLIAMASMVRVVRPQRSAKAPPRMQPSAPTPMVAKVTKAAATAAVDSSAKLV